MMDNFSNFLRQENSALWNLANSEHPFVKGLGDGSLSLDKFQYYLKQDYIFLFDYCKVLAIAASKSDSESMMSKWVTLLDETLNSEMDLHRSFCKDFGIFILNPDTFHYKWIESYNSQEYQEVTDWLITFVNSIGKNIDKDNVEIFSELFKRGIEFEIDFWESAWLLKKN